MPQSSDIVSRDRENAILKRLQGRNPEALGELYDIYGRLAYSAILRIVRSPATAENLVEETFRRVWTRAHLLDPARLTVGPWLLTMARNRALEHLRAPTSWNLAIARRLEDTEDPKLFADWEPDVLNVGSVAALRAELSKLRPSEKMAIDLAYFEGRSQREIADYFGLPLRTIKALLRSALVNLWKAVEGAEPDLNRFRPPVVIRPHKVTPAFGINSALSAGSDIDRDRS